MAKKFTRDEIDELTYDIRALDSKERDIVRKALYARLRVGDGRIGEEELHTVLMKLRKEYKISDIDRRKIEAAFFGD